MMDISVLHKSRVKAYWEGGARVKPDTTSKFHALPYFHIKGKIRHIGPIFLKYAGENTGHTCICLSVTSNVVPFLKDNFIVYLNLLIFCSKLPPFSILSHTT